MTTGVSTTDLWVALAGARAQTTAEALDAQSFERMHVATPLDAFIEEKVGSGFSIVLTGNAGDGKTHLLQRIRPALVKTGAEVVEDATASMTHGNADVVRDRWIAAEAAGRPFCIAANEYPLFQLRRCGAGVTQIDEVTRQCRHRLSYAETQGPEEAARDKVLVIDLSLRNPLVPSFAGHLLNKLLADAPVGGADLGSGVVGARNAERLRHALVRKRLEGLLSKLVSQGARATVRELWIVLSRMIYGDVPSSDYSQRDWYSEILFARDERFDLTAGLTQLDPASCSNPAVDEALEGNLEHLSDGWSFTPLGIVPHPQLDQRTFFALKRRFYFEHRLGDQAYALSDPDAVEFMALLKGDKAPRSITSELVDSINAAFCPVSFPSREEHLYLWSGHRYHEQPSRAFVAAQRVGLDSLRIGIPRLPSRLVGAFDYEPDHLALICEREGHEARLRVDFSLFRSLRRLRRGLPRKLIPERDIYRIDAFIEALSPLWQPEARTLWSVHVENHEVIEVTLSGNKLSYDGVRRHGG